MTSNRSLCLLYYAWIDGDAAMDCRFENCFLTGKGRTSREGLITCFSIIIFNANAKDQIYNTASHKKVCSFYPQFELDRANFHDYFFMSTFTMKMQLFH